MKRTSLSLMVLAALVIGLLPFGAATAQDGAGLPAWGDLDPGVWTPLAPGGDTICLYGDPYTFFVRPATVETDKLLIYFEGGGACWDGPGCTKEAGLATQYDVTPDEMDMYAAGIFDFGNLDNPVVDYNAVFVSYCSGDVHMGDAEVTFTEPSEATVYFKGHTNAMSALNWTFANAPAPSQILLTGSSAGGYGALTHTLTVMDQYPDTPVVVLSDGAAGILPADFTGLDTWNAAASLVPAAGEGYTPDSVMIDAVTAGAAAYPNNTFAQYNTFVDQVQIGFFGIMKGEDMQNADEALLREVATEWSTTLLINLTVLGFSSEKFASFTAGGMLHTVIARPEFYTYMVNNLTVDRWLAKLLAGEIESVGCSFDSGECLVAPGEAAQ